MILPSSVTLFRGAFTAVAIAAAALPAQAQAQSLFELFEAARAYDGAYQSARAQYDATLARADQAQAAVLPTVGLGAGASRSWMEVNVPTTTDRAYGTQNIGVSASQPLYRPANTATAEQGKKQKELAEAQLAAADQDLIVRVSQAYFDVLAARDSLGVVQAQKAAVAEQLAAAKRNFEAELETAAPIFHNEGGGQMRGVENRPVRTPADLSVSPHRPP